MSAPLYDRLVSLSEKEHPFHMPGHKRKPLPYLENMLSLDFTEIPETDDLHSPSSCILDAQKLMSEIYGCDESFFLVNGTSGGILAAILSSCPPYSHKNVIVANNCHISVYNALSLTDATPLYISPEITPYGFSGGISPQRIDEITKKHTDIAACIITSPTYEGFISDIKAIADKLHKKNIPLIVDEAHGAAFSLSSYMPTSAISLGADIVIQSWHKTLPVLTQTSVAHINGSLVNRDLFKHYLDVFQSTSPSFILMAVLDKCREYIQENGEKLFSSFYKNITEFRSSISSLEKIKLIPQDIAGSYSIYDTDISRLVFILNSDMTGKEADDLFYKRYNTRFEMCGTNHLTAVTSISDTSEDFEKLAFELKELDRKIKHKDNILPVKITERKTKIPLNKVFSLETFEHSFDNSAGKISAEYIVPYPPGIPILLPGEIITEDIIKAAKNYKKAGIDLTRIKDTELKKIKCIKI